MTDNKQYPPFPGKPTTSLFSTSIRFVSEEELRDYVDADRAMRAAQAAPTSQDTEDAARYRWLRECNSGSLVVAQITGIGEEDWHVLTERDADEAIDAARSKQEGK